MDHFAPDVTYEGAATGANKIWQCGIMAVRGILGQNPDQLKMAVDGLGTEFKYVTGKDGFYEDGSFVQHQWHPYTGGYGRSMLSQMADLIALLSGTPWAVPQPYEAMLYEWIHNGYEPLVYRGAMMDMVRGREISRPGLYRPLGRAQHPRVDAPAERSGPCGGEGAPAGFREGERALGR